MEIDKLESGSICPEMSGPLMQPDGTVVHQMVPCIGRKCNRFIMIKGKDPTSEKLVDQWDCAYNWEPILQIETSQFVKGVQATVQDLRNESKANIGAIRELNGTLKTFVKMIQDEQQKQLEEDNAI